MLESLGVRVFIVGREEVLVGGVFFVWVERVLIFIGGFLGVRE